MISAVADSCSVRLDKVNGKVYKFHALVFNPDSQGNNKEAYLRRKNLTSASVTRGILSQQPKTEWKCAYNELLSGIKDLPKQKEDSSPGPIRKRSKTVSQDSFSNESEVSKIDKQRVRFTGVEEGSVVETPKCPTCLQVIPKDTKDFDSLMEKSKEELVTIIMNLNMNLQNRRRKQGYCPSEKDIAQLMQLNINKPDQTAPKTKPTRTRRRLNRSKRLTSI
ncbi:uncharacterized protein LOC110055247 [Orbicella faveolata]|uniref:uncharacterized protein LOC110055247 n=1 Tax=Orbicella faveolata TaxID=48498 RepID=UPI0009E3E7D3|nr:uncharacterized protein LOC110055247 [Orbicella faveolata]XP_020617288.1 uncharacterized protein LOC110055247 [Orbicella faveolata]XP_020617289.1 uncharacterized protein LOC110055247 [Orbicella faveolata]